MTYCEMQLDWNWIETDDLPEPFKEIADDVGVDIVKYLVENWGGAVIYVPTLTRLMSRCLDKTIRSEYTGANEMDLARQYGVSRARVRKALRRK